MGLIYCPCKVKEKKDTKQVKTGKTLSNKKIRLIQYYIKLFCKDLIAEFRNRGLKHSEKNKLKES